MLFRLPLPGATLARLAAALAMIMLALSVTAASRADAQICKPLTCDVPEDPDVPPPVSTTYTREFAVADTGVVEHGGERQQTRASITVTYSRATNAPLRAYIATRNHAWNYNWFVGFTAKYRVNVFHGLALRTMTSLREVNVCPRLNSNGCFDRTTSSQDAIPLDFGGVPFDQLRLEIDQFFN